eukprot:CAMPEP_0118945368 /NCGR_PEP_ID=MMETSP1169-20130426/42109_1 /TAXON_ID=36882 /ORGANISM="Pyramimonas obovata, Strain CCMP722" /LENGTH=346 /DNA_ID=CAMNT_0006891061 /DNA_START=298 /DNA_END=1334 /DNA_ORIENTATION=-
MDGAPGSAGERRSDSPASFTIARKRGHTPGVQSSFSDRNPNESTFSFWKQLSKPRVILLFIMAVTSCTFLDMVTTEDDDKLLVPGLNRKSLHVPLTQEKTRRERSERSHVLGEGRHGAPRPPREHYKPPPNERTPDFSKRMTHEGTNRGFEAPNNTSSQPPRVPKHLPRNFTGDPLYKLPLPDGHGWKGFDVPMLVLNRQSITVDHTSYPEGMDAEAFQQLQSKGCIPATDVDPQAKTCAVVGNGGVNLDVEYGRGIDAAEIVLRFNDGPTKGFEQHVGHRTSFRLVNNAWSMKLASQRRPLPGTTGSAYLSFGKSSTKQLAGMCANHKNSEVFYISTQLSYGART